MKSEKSKGLRWDNWIMGETWTLGFMHIDTGVSISAFNEMKGGLSMTDE